jgi:DNA-binding PadR family transcriptional regulator
MPAMVGASELECTVLALVWREPKMSAYAIRQHFLRSPSSQWSGSAGAIYPLVKRLERRGWLRSNAMTKGERAGSVYSLTPAGRQVMHEWLAPPLAPELASAVPDPLRTRMYFLGALSPAERRRFLNEAQAHLEGEVRIARAALRKTSRQDDRFAYAAIRGVILTMRARLLWIRTVRGSLTRKP